MSFPQTSKLFDECFQVCFILIQIALWNEDEKRWKMKQDERQINGTQFARVLLWDICLSMGQLIINL
jgi:hypothetical protein